MRLATLLMLSFALLACSNSSNDSGSSSSGSGDGAEARSGNGAGDPGGGAEPGTGEQAGGGLEDAGGAACEAGQRTVTLQTSDGVALEADLLLPDDPRGAAVLVHMIPPAWDRSSWPPRVREALADLGYAVLALDRRGAGQSAGEAEDAYVGEGGRLDVEAAVRYLQTLPEDCGALTEQLALIGASNGTTSVLDYVVARDEALPAPTAVVWLSPGEYTGNQHAVDEVRDVLDPLRLMVAYPTSEPWSEQFTTETPAGWELIELTDGLHGTRNFDDGALEAQLLAAMTAFLRL